MITGASKCPHLVVDNKIVISVTGLKGPDLYRDSPQPMMWSLFVEELQQLDREETTRVRSLRSAFSPGKSSLPRIISKDDDASSLALYGALTNKI